MTHSGQTKSKATALPLLLFVAAALLFPLAHAQTRRARAASARTRQPARAARQSATPTPAPIVVPRQPAAAAETPVQVPSRGPAQKPAPTPNPTPAPPPRSGETEDALDDEEVVRVTSNLVVVPVSVTDARGGPVQGLKLGDFRLEEEGRAQELAQVGDAEQVPLDIAVLFDASSSVSEEYKFQQEAAARFLTQVLKPIDRAAVFSITGKPKLEQPLASSAVAAAKLVSIPAAAVATPTAFYDTVKAAAKYLAENAPARNRRVILVVSDGEDNFSDRIRDAAADVIAEGKAVAQGETVAAGLRRQQQARHAAAVQDALRVVQGADAVFYSINPTGPSLRLNEISTRAQNSMHRMAETTGGNSFVPASSADLDAIFRQIAAELRAQYLLQYLSNADAPAGKFLRIKVNTPARADLRVRARQGYYKK